MSCIYYYFSIHSLILQNGWPDIYVVTHHEIKERNLETLKLASLHNSHTPRGAAAKPPPPLGSEYCADAEFSVCRFLVDFFDFAICNNIHVGPSILQYEGRIGKYTNICKKEVACWLAKSDEVRGLITL